MRATTAAATVFAILALREEGAAAPADPGAGVFLAGEAVSSVSAPEAGPPASPMTFTSADGLYRVSLGARAQVRYMFLDADQADAPAPDLSEWRVRRAKLWLAGWAYSRRLTYRLQAGLESAGTPRLLDDAYLDYRFRDEIEIRAGQFKTPFTREDLISAGALELVDRANAVDTFKTGRDIGAMLRGGLFAGRLTYQAGVFGGAGQSATRRGADTMVVARVVASPFGRMTPGEGDLRATRKPLLSFGADLFHNALRKTGPRSLESATPPYAGANGWLGRELALFGPSEKIGILTWSVDAAFKWRGLSLQAEYLRGRAEGRETGTVLRARGAYVQAGYLILPGRLGFAARYSSVDPNLDASRDRWNEAQGAVSWYFQKHKVKLQADYTDIRRERGAQTTTDDRQIRLQAQVEF